MNNLTILDHPLIQQKLTYLRTKDTPHHQFRTLLNEISALMVYEITRNFPTKIVEVETPLEKTNCKIIASQVTLVAILRAGIGMLDGVLHLLPTAKVGHLGIYRDEKTLQPVEYFAKLPVDIVETEVILVDPMLATGGSTCFAINYLLKKGVKNIRFMCLVSSPEGVKKVHSHYPNIQIYTCSLDRELNSKGYIVPGLGDAGDRIFGTK